jgi:hypothetical protein
MVLKILLIDTPTCKRTTKNILKNAKIQKLKNASI